MAPLFVWESFSLKQQSQVLAMAGASHVHPTTFFFFCFTFMFGTILTEFARPPETRIVLKQNADKSTQVSLVKPQNYKLLRSSNGDESEQVVQSDKLNQQEFVSMVLKRRKRAIRYIDPLRHETIIEDENQLMAVPPPRINPHSYEDENEVIIEEEEKQILPEPPLRLDERRYRVIPEIEEEEDEVIIDISNDGRKEVHVPLHSYHKAHNDKNDKSKDKRGKNDKGGIEDIRKQFKPLWILIALSILAFIIILLLMWYFIPRQFMKKVQSGKSGKSGNESGNLEQ